MNCAQTSHDLVHGEHDLLQQFDVLMSLFAIKELSNVILILGKGEIVCGFLCLTAGYNIKQLKK